MKNASYKNHVEATPEPELHWNPTTRISKCFNKSTDVLERSRTELEKHDYPHIFQKVFHNEQEPVNRLNRNRTIGHQDVVNSASKIINKPFRTVINNKKTPHAP